MDLSEEINFQRGKPLKKKKAPCGGGQENNTKSLSTLMATSRSRCVQSKNTTQSYKTTRLKNFKHSCND